MQSSTTNQVEGALHKLKGAVKEKVGEIINDPDLQTEGQAEKLAGKVQSKIGQIEKVLDQ